MNWCSNETIVFGPKDALDRFVHDFKDAISSNPSFKRVKNDFGDEWLGNIFSMAGIDPLSKNIRCRGFITDVDDYNGEEFIFRYESAWGPIIESIDLLLEKYGLKEVTYYEQIDFGDYGSNDVEHVYFDDKYYVDVCYRKDEELNYIDEYVKTDEGLLNLFEEIGLKFNTVDELLVHLDEIDVDDEEFYNVHIIDYSR